MERFIDPYYRIDIFLDTNILVDYIEGRYQSLSYSLEYLNQSGYVTFHTSQYVLYEFIEVRKFNLYLNHLKLKTKDLSKSKEKLKSKIKRNNWKYNGVEYGDSIQKKIEEQILEELTILENVLDLQTNTHILHKDLYHPSKLCVLKTPISKEDSLILTSSLLPQEGVRLAFGVLLSGDKAYGDSFNKCSSIIQTLPEFNDAQIKFIKTIELKNPNKGTKINLRNTTLTNEELRVIWNNILIQLLIEKNSSSFVGKTYKCKSKQPCIFFKMPKSSIPLKSDGNFVIIPNDLSFSPLHIENNLGILHFNEKIKFPHYPIKKPRDYKYSFKAPAYLKTKMDILSQPDNLIFYDNDIPESN